MVETLIGDPVSYAANDSLIKDERFDRHMALPHDGLEVLFCKHFFVDYGVRSILY